MRLGFVVVLLAGVLAGCSEATNEGATQAPVTESTTSSATSPAEPTPAPLSKPDAARRYLDIVKPYNEALENLEQAINDGQDLEVQQTSAGELVGANEQQIKDLESVVWPADVRDAMAELVAESRKAQPFLREAAQAGSTDDLVEALLAAMEHDGAEPAEKIRAALDLDAYDETEYGGS